MNDELTPEQRYLNPIPNSTPEERLREQYHALTRELARHGKQVYLNAPPDGDGLRLAVNELASRLADAKRLAEQRQPARQPGDVIVPSPTLRELGFEKEAWRAGERARQRLADAFELRGTQAVPLGKPLAQTRALEQQQSSDGDDGGDDDAEQRQRRIERKYLAPVRMTPEEREQARDVRWRELGLVPYYHADGSTAGHVKPEYLAKMQEMIRQQERK